METFYYIKLRDQISREELFKIGVCSTTVAERWGRENGTQFDDSKYSIAHGSKTKKYNTPMEILLIDSWAFHPDPNSEISPAYAFEQLVKTMFKPYQAVNVHRWSYLKQVVRTGMSELFSRDIYDFGEVIESDDVRRYLLNKASEMGGKLTSEKEARKLVAYIGKEKLARKYIS